MPDTETVKTGFMVRAMRLGEWHHFDIAELNDVELQMWADRALREQPKLGYAWAKALAAWIRDNVRMPEPSEEPCPKSE